jgi:murein DD-endopeptidase MepM/ murein hydrolase activator NlpD
VTIATTRLRFFTMMFRSIPRNWTALQLSLILVSAGLGPGAIAQAQWQRQPQTPPQQAALMRPGLWREASFPVENFQTYTSPFGYRRLSAGSQAEFHSGLDVAAPEGSYIRNWWLGTVEAVSDTGRCGTSITIQSGNWSHIYCHMSGRVEVINGRRTLVDRAGGIQLSEGQLVNTGSRIGRVGMTGRTSGPHLHWGLKFNGQWVDPARVLQAMSDSLAQSSPDALRDAGRSGGP